MDCAKTGALIRSLRLEKGYTQQKLADELNISGKTVSKWERGLGCPDVSLLPSLSAVLGVDLSRMLSGDLAPNESEAGNMKKANYYLCPECGSIALCSGNARLYCCGRLLEPLKLRKAAPQEKLKAEMVEDEWFISSDHPMEKGAFIPFVAWAAGAKVELVRQYPEWPLQLRIPRRGRGMLIWHDPALGLLYQLL